VFLSTDAGGTGLNLQVADTVVNLELPWNPAVLEQRIARVHRMGQNKAVRVINLVTRGTIEERVLRTIEQKQNLFAGVFDGDEDEIAFTGVSRSKFLDAVRELIGEPKAEPAVATTAPATAPTGDGSHAAFWRAGVQMVGALSAALGENGSSYVEKDLRTKLRKAVADLLQKLDDAGG
jgi:hypothetical protein